MWAVGSRLSSVKSVFFVALCRDGMYESLCIKCTLSLVHLSLGHRQTETRKLSLNGTLNVISKNSEFLSLRIFIGFVWTKILFL